MFRIIAMYAKNSKYSHISPLEKLVLCIGCILLNSFSTNLVTIIINIIVFILLHVFAKNPIKYVLKLVMGLAAFSLVSAITFVFDYGIGYTVILVTKSLASALCLLLLSFTTPLNHILYYLSKIKFLRDVCDIIKSTERFIISIEDEGRIIYNAIKVRGGFETKVDIVKNTGKLVGLLFLNTLKAWKEIRDAVNARCYSGKMVYFKGDFTFKSYRFLAVLTYLAANLYLMKL